ncbi:hypothetical protein DFH28DRAFT_924668 [Melampsora americana]|nr:hypothetical protein DFH28DRAFT_924668 [Melampsora americana]
MLTVPLISKSGLWYASYQPIQDPYIQKEVYVGFWGVCSYDVGFKTHRINHTTCTPISLAYSFKLFNHQVNEHKQLKLTPGLELNITQTTVFLWYPIVSILILTGMILSTSKNLKNLKRSSICYLMSSLITFSVYSGTLMIFFELKNQFLKTQINHENLIPIDQSILSSTHLPLISGTLLFLNSFFSFIKFKSFQVQVKIDEENQESKVNLDDHSSIHSVDSNLTVIDENQFMNEKFRKEEVHLDELPPAYYPSKPNQTKKVRTLKPCYL